MFDVSAKHWLEACAAWALERGIGAMSPSRASACGGALFRRLGRYTRADDTARTNLRRIYSLDRADDLTASIWQNLGQTLFEYPHLNTLVRDGRVQFVGLDVVRSAIAAGRGGVFFSGHLANWECVPMLAQAGQFDVAVMYRAPNNPRVAQVLDRCRPSDHLRFIAKSMAGTKQAFGVLANRGFVGFLIDHRYNRGVEVDFLGGRAIVAPTAALMAQRYGCPLIPVRTERLGPLSYRVSVLPPLGLDYSLPHDQFAQTVMQSAMSILEGWILDRPDQWFWMQRLWR